MNNVSKLDREQCLKQKKRIAITKMEIDNFILYWTSNDEERERMRVALKSFIEEVL